MEIDIQCIAQTFRQYGEAARLYADMDSFLHDDYDEMFCLTRLLTKDLQ